MTQMMWLMQWSNVAENRVQLVRDQNTVGLVQEGWAMIMTADQYVVKVDVQRNEVLYPHD